MSKIKKSKRPRKKAEPPTFAARMGWTTHGKVRIKGGDSPTVTADAEWYPSMRRPVPEAGQ